MRGSVQLFAYDEPHLTPTLDAWAAQDAPDGVSIAYEVWVTPTTDPREADPTWRQVADHPAFAAREAPPYKLPSRNIAHDTAISRGDDFFVACDADAPPLAENALTGLSRPLRETGVSAVCANPVAPARRPAGLYVNLGVFAKEAIGGMHGQCHAVTADGWRHAGPFDESIDHTDIASVWAEEEYRFAHRLRQHGTIRYRWDAPVANDTRRRECSWRRALRQPLDPYCGRQERTDTFRPSTAHAIMAHIFDR